MSDRTYRSVAEAEAAWRETYRPESLSKVVLPTGIEIKPYYGPQDWKPTDDEYLSKVGLPGEYPYTRGAYPLMYRSKVWTMRQYAGFATAEETNQNYRDLLAAGAHGLSVAFDLPTQMGFDSDSPEAGYEVGRVGVAIDSLADAEALFAGIPLDRVSTSFTINAVTNIILAMYQAVGEKQGVKPEQLMVTVQNDNLKEYIARGAWIFNLRNQMKMVGDTIEYTSRHMPKSVPVSICGYHIRESGANAAQEVAYSFLSGMAYIEQALSRELDIDAFAPRLSFNMTAHMNLFEEVAKFRAARRIWARLLRERYGAKNPKSWKWIWFAGTGGATYTRQQPENNIIRGTLECLALVLGGVQSVTVNTKDEGHMIPSEKAKLIALRTQQIIAEESGVADTADPLAGSYFVESLTDQMEAEIWKYISDVESKGGMIQCIEDGYVQKQILLEAVKWQRQVDSGQRRIVGVNCYQMDEEDPTDLYHPDPTAREKQVNKLRRLRAERDNEKLEAALRRLDEACREGENTVYPILECVRAYGTVGEITRVLKNAFGVFEEPLNLF